MAVYDSAENYSVNESGLQSPRSMIWVEAVLIKLRYPRERSVDAVLLSAFISILPGRRG